MSKPNAIPKVVGKQGEPSMPRKRRPLRLWFVIAVCVMQAGLITLLVALIFSGAQEAAARVPGEPSPVLAMVGGALVSAYLAAAFGLLLRQAWARGMALTLLVLSAFATVAVVLTLSGEEPRPMSERWLDLAALSPMMLLQFAAFAVLALSQRQKLFERRA